MRAALPVFYWLILWYLYTFSHKAVIFHISLGLIIWRLCNDFFNGNYAISVSLITIQLISLRETSSNLISFKTSIIHKASEDSEAI